MPKPVRFRCQKYERKPQETADKDSVDAEVRQLVKDAPVVKKIWLNRNKIQSNPVSGTYDIEDPCLFVQNALLNGSIPCPSTAWKKWTDQMLFKYRDPLNQKEPILIPHPPEMNDSIASSCGHSEIESIYNPARNFVFDNSILATISEAENQKVLSVHGPGEHNEFSIESMPRPPTLRPGQQQLKSLPPGIKMDRDEDGNYQPQKIDRQNLKISSNLELDHIG